MTVTHLRYTFYYILVNECDNKTNPVCLGNSTCRNMLNSYICDCSTGYTYSGTQCEGKLSYK